MWSKNAIILMEKRYLKRNERGEITETPEQMFKRVAKHVALAEKKYGENWKESYEVFLKLMLNRDFLPNSPTLMNAGTRIGQLSACFVLPIYDSMESIFTSLKHMAIIHKSGGGTGFNFSHLRPKGDIVASTHGVASGPVSFMKVYDTATEVIKQGGKRRGANMGILNINHPDILEFVMCKYDGVSFPNFNISVGIYDDFMKKQKNGKSYELINPRTGEVTDTVDSKGLFNIICKAAWKTGDPGLLFLDTINKNNPLPERIEATNPCGEVPLPPYESCNLGSVNLANMVEDGNINWEKLEFVVKTGVRFLDNVIDVNKFPIPQIKKATTRTRRIGLGVMGFAEMLVKLGISYNSNKAVKLATKLMKFIHEKSIEASIYLGKTRGYFPCFEETDLNEPRRNIAVNAIAPTGSISIIAGVTSSIEPFFALVYTRHVLEGKELLETNSLFEQELKRRGLYNKKILEKIIKRGSIADIEELTDLHELFITALEIPPEQHIRIQAAFQKHTDNAVSKTINLPKETSTEDVKKAYLLAYKLGCKGITLYRYGSKEEQVLYLGKYHKKTAVAHDYSGGCAKEVCHI